MGHFTSLVFVGTSSGVLMYKMYSVLLRDDAIGEPASLTVYAACTSIFFGLERAVTLTRDEFTRIKFLITFLLCISVQVLTVLVFVEPSPAYESVWRAHFHWACGSNILLGLALLHLNAREKKFAASRKTMR